MNRVCFLVAVVFFAVVAVLAVTDTVMSAKTHEFLLFGGLTAFAAGHL